MKKAFWAIGLAAALTASAAAGTFVSAEAADAEITRGGVLKIGFIPDIVNIGYPGLSTASNELIAQQPAVEPLCRYTEEGELEPWLIEGYETDAEALTLTVHLKEGIKFHDGSDFNSEAVKWNWETFTEMGRNEIAAISSRECPDDYTVVAHLDHWDNTIPDQALYLAGFMYSPAYCQEVGKDVANNSPCGTGPFKFVEWQKDVKIVYEANEDYWIEGQPYLDGIEIEFISEANTVTSAYEADEISVIPVTNPDVVQIMQSYGEENKAREGVFGGAGINICAFGCTDESDPVSNLLVRQAFCHAVNWEELCEIAGGGAWYYSNQWALPGTWSYNENVVGYPYDVEKAKELLAEAGYPDGCDVTLITLEANNTTATMIQQYLAEAGINMTIENIDQAKQDEIAGINGNWAGTILSAGRADLETASIYGRSFTDEGVRYVNGFLHPDDLVDTIAKARSATTQEERAELCQAASKMIIDDYCMIAPLGISKAVYYKKDNVHDDGFCQTHLVVWTPNACWIG